MRTNLSLLLCMLLFASCSNKMSEADKFWKDVVRDVDFSIDSLRPMGKNWATFTNSDITSYQPDYVMSKDGSVNVERMLYPEPPRRQAEDKLWRNLFFNNRHHRLVCVDRMIRQGRAQGVVYVMQSKSKKYPSFGTYHWDVTDRRNFYSLAWVLDDYRKQSLNIMSGKKNGYLSTVRQYDALITKADSCYRLKNYDKSLNYFEQALKYSSCIKGVHLYNAACVAALSGNTDQAVTWLRQRMRLEPKWYMRDFNRDKDLEPLRKNKRWQELISEMDARRNAVEKQYDNALRSKLLKIEEADQQIRQLWMSASAKKPTDKQQLDSIYAVMAKVDSANQKEICGILDSKGFVGKSVVGEACSAFWVVIQHSTLELQQKYLPIFQKAVKNGDLQPSSVAMMEDRINMFQGKPQKYGSQIRNGRVWMLLDESKVDQWRAQVGMKPLGEYLRKMGARR